MPVDHGKARDQWERYVYCRDRGHLKFVDKANLCDEFVAGYQWSDEDAALLRQQRRPALTINKIISTVSTVLGEQINNRAEISFQPKSGSPSDTADALTKVWRQIAQANQLPWVRSDVFAEGIIRSRGFYDVRLDFTDSMAGEVRIKMLGSKNVILDPDGDSYDPDEWNDFFISKWLTAQDIELLYNKADADYLYHVDASEFLYGYDSIEMSRDRFGGNILQMLARQTVTEEVQKLRRKIRVLERQFRELHNQEHFVDLQTGDMRPIPESWDRNRIAMVKENLDLGVVTKRVKRIRWRVTADHVVLHDAWSPYKHFTVVPYFPLFRAGRTLGLVEHLIGSQELLNKTTSQELHVVNTTANSGWKLKVGALKNMDVEELEQRGSQTGIVLELDDINNAEKIQPNSVPTGLDRLSYKAEEHIKTISNVTDSMQGNDREDVAARAIQAKQVRGSVNFSKMMDNMQRTDWLLARNVMDCVQEYYTEQRLVNITGDGLAQEREEITVNQISPEGTIVNDLTIGEYDIVITSVPFRATLEDEQFDQAVQLRELGVKLPDDILIENSRLLNKTELVRKMRAQAESPEAQADQQLNQRAKEAEVSKTEAEVEKSRADAQLNSARAAKEGAEVEGAANGESPEMVKIRAEAKLQMGIEREKMAMQREKHDQEMSMEREKHQNEMAIRAQAAADDARLKRAQAAQQAALKPKAGAPTAVA